MVPSSRSGYQLFSSPTLRVSAFNTCAHQNSPDRITMDPKLSSNTLFDELWNQALDGYFDSMNRSPEEKAALKRIHSTEDLSSQLEAGHGKFGDWRNKHSKFFSILSKSVRPFVLVSEIAQSAVGLTPFAPASTILGAVFCNEPISSSHTPSSNIAGQKDETHSGLSYLGSFQARYPEMK